MLKTIAFLSVHCCAVLSFSGAGLAQDAIPITDKNAGYSMEIDSSIEWTIDVDLAAGQSTAVAVSPEGYEPFSIFQGLTMLQVNPAALSDAEKIKTTTESFLGGLCTPFKCGDTSSKTYEKIGNKQGWLVATKVNHPDYIASSITDSIFFATTSPKGYMQLFSVHTSEGNVESLRSVLINAVESIEYSAQ